MTEADGKCSRVAANNGCAACQALSLARSSEDHRQVPCTPSRRQKQTNRGCNSIPALGQPFGGHFFAAGSYSLETSSKAALALAASGKLGPLASARRKDSPANSDRPEAR